MKIIKKQQNKDIIQNDLKITKTNHLQGANGITLIALVITIIVLLILAAVSIATLTGQNGILSRADESKTQTEIGEEEEAIKLAYNGVMADNLGDGVTARELEDEMKANGYDVTAEEVNGKIKVTFGEPSNRVYEIDANGNITKVTTPSTGDKPGKPNGDNIFQEPSTIDGGVASSNNPTIPAGFRPMDTETSKWGDGTSAPSTGDLENGLVITDAPDGVNGNEFVWIPASVDEMATAKTGIDTNGNQNYEGKLYNFTSTGANVTTSYREPDIVADYDGDTEKNYLDIINGILGTTYSSNNTSTFLDDMQKDYNAMIKSVGKYGGFYIGRYEISKSDSNTAQSKKNVVALTADNYSTTASQNGNTWYGLYAYGKKYTNQNKPNSVESSMIWGSQYDAMLRWMQSGDNKVDVTGNIGGNRNTSNTITGETETDVIRNIYDIYGGRFEWTLEADRTKFRDNRGRLILP